LAAGASCCADAAPRNPKLAAMMAGKANEVGQRPVAPSDTILPHIMSTSPEDRHDQAKSSRLFIKLAT
jgi:hypothetical protein